MTLDEAVTFFGSAYRLTKDLNISRNNATKWRKNGYIPHEQQLKIEQLTRGTLRADNYRFRKKTQRNQQESAMDH